jgi:hypothetical protein
VNAKDAKQYVLRVLAQTLMQDRGNGSYWLEQDPDTREEMSEADCRRVLKAAHVVEKELRRRGGLK